MPTNLTNITNIDSVYDWGLYASNSTAGLFWGILLIVLFVIIVIRLRHLETEKAVAAASFACFILSLIFLNLNFVQFFYPIIFALFLAGTLLFMKFKPEKTF